MGTQHLTYSVFYGDVLDVILDISGIYNDFMNFSRGHPAFTGMIEIVMIT